MALTAIDPRSALVVIDLQKGSLGSTTFPHTVADVIDRTTTLADAFRSRDLPVVLVRVVVSGGALPAGRTESGRTPGPLPAGAVAIVDALAGHDGDIVVSKRNPGAFYGTDLDLHLRRRGVTQIVLAGISTTMGVEATARDAFEHGYNVVLVTDAMSDYDAESHAHSITKILPRIGETATTDVIDDELRRSRG